MHDKKAFLLSLMDPKPEGLEVIQIDLDVDDVTICDILRNFNQLFPENCRDRFEIKDGRMVYAIICKSEYLSPFNGIVILIGHDLSLNAQCRRYLILSIDEADITTEDRINRLNDSITKYLVSDAANGMPEFQKFYVRYMYNDYEELGE